MTIASLSEVLQEAKKNNYAVAGLVVLGWEDARCYAESAEELKCLSFFKQDQVVEQIHHCQF